MNKQLQIAPPSSQFTMSQEDKLIQHLRELDNHTILYVIDSPECVSIDGDGLVGGRDMKARLTTTALYQLCQDVCQGLYGFVRELAGEYKAPEDERTDYCFDDAIDILNRVIKRRFDTRLLGKILLYNTHEKTIDGILGAKYKLLSNISLYERAKEVMEAHDSSLCFYEAILNGRWLMLRFAGKKPYFKLKVPERDDDAFYSGYHFSNDEVGMSSCRAAAFLLRDSGRTSALTAIEDKEQRIRHEGSSFSDRLSKMFPRVLTQLRSAEFYTQRLDLLRQESLPVDSPDPIAAARMRDGIARRMVNKDLPVAVTTKIVSSAVTISSYPQSRYVPMKTRIYTMYDLYNAIGREAKSMPIRHREAAEQYAYSLLLGKHSLKN